MTEVERLAAFLDAPRPTLSDTVNSKTRLNKASVLTLLAWSGRTHAPTTPARDEAKWKPGRRCAAPAGTPASARADRTDSAAAAAAAAAGAEPAQRQQLQGVQTLPSRLRDGAHAAPDPAARSSFALEPAPAKEDETFCVDHHGAQCALNSHAPSTIAADSQREQQQRRRRCRTRRHRQRRQHEAPLAVHQSPDRGAAAGRRPRAQDLVRCAAIPTILRACMRHSARK